VKALTEAERDERRNLLARCAAEVLGDVGWNRLTIDAVAQGAGVSKGSVFLFFASKEDLVLHAAALGYEAWFRRLEELDPTVPAPDLAQRIAVTLRADPHLLPLMGLVGPVLEQGCSPEAVIRFKEGLAARFRSMASAWGARLPHVAPEVWQPLFLQVHAVLIGAWSAGEASERVRQALAERPDLWPLLTRFDDLVLPLLEAQLRRLET
jgi:AcrR family transcriptional regulator